MAEGEVKEICGEEDIEWRTKRRRRGFYLTDDWVICCCDLMEDAVNASQLLLVLDSHSVICLVVAF